MFSSLRLRILVLSVILVVLSISMAACSGGPNAEAENPPPAPESVGDPVLGEEIFNARHGDAPACTMCHLVEGDRRKTGPSLFEVGERAGNQVEGQEAVDYLRESIINPTAYDADPERNSRMFTGYSQFLSEADINNVIAYLLTLH